MKLFPFPRLQLFDYILDRSGKVKLQAIDAPPTEWTDPLAAFEATLQHEQQVTARIDNLVYLARDEKDNASEIFLQWYVKEQVEEEENAGTLVGQLKLIKDSPETLFMMDKDLAQRIFTPPAAEEGGA